MYKLFRVHGDNIIECERVIAYIRLNVVIHSFKKSLSSLACLSVDIEFDYAGSRHHWIIELFPGFSKESQNQRWETNIFGPIQANGGFLDETPDAVITHVENGRETILLAIEFCSALQAGNQAWQRSGRAYSVGRTGCPYIYVVDFVKYELEPNTRERKNLRFPNPVVPFSYISFSKQTGNFVAQAYIRAEEFDSTNETLESFDKEWFSENFISDFIIQKMMGLSTAQTEINILKNNFSVVEFIASRKEDKNSFSVRDWQLIYNTDADILEYSKNRPNGFKFEKTITRKAQSDGSKMALLAATVREMSIGLAKNDLPFGIMPSNKISNFVYELKKIYPSIASDFDVLNSINEDYIICMVKGFKPGGNDNRPDRGILPLVTMLTSDRVYILSCIYGPLIENNYQLLISDPIQLSKNNGFWQVFLSLSDFLLLDTQLLSTSETIHAFIDNRKIKREFVAQKNTKNFSLPAISNEPTYFREDDVDTVLHYIFSSLLRTHAFEGMCNPPGGDWSGLSVFLNGYEYRWLSLPRVSANDAKRPDHVVELFIPNSRPVLIILESKERSNNLENLIGRKLRNYISWLMSFPPSVARTINTDWHTADKVIDINSLDVISAAAFLSENNNDAQYLFQKSKCDLLFILTPNAKSCFWKIEIFANSDSIIAEKSKQFLLRQLADGKNEFIITVQPQMGK
ncbi:MAG: hypothetical protein LBC63_03430 [Holophagales bacterium]|jgi:hypothetical protein|nr:hypothetical protein [Holophagales bacterium]